MNSIAKNVRIVREKIAVAARSCARDPEEVTLVAVCKTQPLDAVQAAISSGQFVFGENKIQEAVDKYKIRPEKIELHMVGHLQSNKTRFAAALFDRIHSIDSLKTARRLDLHLAEAGRTMKALVQVNLGREAQKSGIAEADVEALLLNLSALEHLTVDGLMVLPPFYDDPEKTIPYFRGLKSLRDRLADRDLGGISLHHLSMGMTADYPQAIREGATIVRVGTAIFGPRNYSA